MPQILNAFSATSPIGQMLSELGSSLWGDQATGEYNRQRALEQQRLNDETTNLMRQIAEGGGVQELGADPVTQAMLIGSGYGPDDFARIGLMGAATGYGARDPMTTNWTVGAGLPYGNTAEAFDLDLAETARAHDLTDATNRYNIEQDYAADIYGINTVDARERDFWNAEPQPAMFGGEAVFLPRELLPRDGVSPILSETEARGINLMDMFPQFSDAERLAVLGATPSLTEGMIDGVPTYVPTAEAAGLPVPQDPYTLTPGDQRRGANNEIVAEMPPAAAAPSTTWNYITPDGQAFLTNNEQAALGLDLQGNPMPPGGTRGELTGGADALGLTNAARTDAQSDILAINKFNLFADMMQGLLDDPASQWGVVGWVQSKAQELLQAVGNIVDLVAPEDQAVVRQFLPELYNPNLPAQQTLHTLVLYAGAAALAGQENRSVSDADILRMREAFPSPFGLFSSRNSVQASLDVVRQLIDGLEGISRRALTEGVGAAEAPAAPPGPPEEAPAAQPEQPQTFVDADGVLWELKDWNGDGVPVWGHE